MPASTPSKSFVSPAISARAKSPGSRLTAAETMALHEIADLNDPALSDSVIPACCADGCHCEPDGYCEHNHPSLFLVWGVI